VTPSRRAKFDLNGWHSGKNIDGERRKTTVMKASPTPPVDKSDNKAVVFVDTRGIKNIKYVIFPNNKWIQLWDLWMIFAIWYYAFATPFAIGISRGYISGKDL
jgi:hypothetical protein